jgi:hypothetical protein
MLFAGETICRGEYPFAESTDIEAPFACAIGFIDTGMAD